MGVTQTLYETFFFKYSLCILYVNMEFRYKILKTKLIAEKYAPCKRSVTEWTAKVQRFLNQSSSYRPNIIIRQKRIGEINKKSNNFYS